LNIGLHAGIRAEDR